MNIVYLDLRPFSHHIKSGFRQRAGRILNHFIKSDRIDRFQYIWWNDDPFVGIRDKLPVNAEYNKMSLVEARRLPIPFARRLQLSGGLFDEPRIRKIARKCHNLKSNSVWIWATDPRLAVPAKKLANRLNGKLCVDLIDNFVVRDEVQGKRREAYRKGYENTVRLADKIVANNLEMQRFLRIPDKTFKFIANGVDWQVFHDGENLPEPSDIASIPRPRVGFLGVLSSLNDVSPLNAVADELPNCEVVVVGNTNVALETLHKRIHVLGMKSYNDVPAYISSFDICISIYQNNTATLYIDSQKIKEYLAAGKRVVALHYPQSSNESIYISVARDLEEFVRMVREAISVRVDADLREKISLSVADQDWKNRISEILAFLEDKKS